MADLFDVENAFSSLLTAILYPATVTISGTATAGDVVKVIATPQRGNAITASYTVQPGDTPTTIAAGLNTAWVNATPLLGNTTSSVGGAVLTLNLAPGDYTTPPGNWTVTASVSGAQTEIATVSGVPVTDQQAPAVSAPVVIGVGWPDGATLDGIAATQIGQPAALVSVFAPEGYYRDATRYDGSWRVLADPTQTLTVSVNSLETQITLGGTVSPQVVAAIVGGKAYVYDVLGTDTLNSIAAALAALINIDTPASASGPLITVPNAPALTARVGAQGTVFRELSRQIERIYIDIWAPTPGLRSSLAKAIAPQFAKAKFILLPDLTGGHVMPCGSRDIDDAEKPGLYRRCLMYDVEYATIEARPAQQIVTFEAQQTGGALGAAPNVNTFI